MAEKVNACTLWPDRWGSYDLSAACALHDEDYESQSGFWSSNLRLYKNVRNASPRYVVGHVMGAFMFMGVTVVGPFFYAQYKKKYP